MTNLDPAEVIFNPLEPGYVADPFPHLAQMRTNAPVQQTLAGPWALFAHDDVFRLLRDPELSVDDVNADLSASQRAVMFEEMFGDDLPERDTSILNTDPPDHTRLRRLVSKVFTPRAIDSLTPMIQELVDHALDQMQSDGLTNVVDRLAFPLPFEVISEMMGMPDSDRDQIRDWSEALVKTLDPILTEDEVRAAHDANIAMRDHIDSVIEWKRANPGDDLMTRLIDAEEDGDRLSATELRDQISVLFVAGHETTVNLVGTGIYELLRHADQMRLWIDDPSLGSNAIEELLRFVTPVQFSRRIATSDIEYGGQTIPKGSFVLAILASSNRDPAYWGPNAEQLDLRREGAGTHLSFGSGIHYCLGASLAKLEGRIAIGSFITRFPNAKVIGEPVWNGRINLRGLGKLMVDLTP